MPLCLSGLRSARHYSMQLGYCGLLLLATWLSLASMVSRDYDQAIREIEQNNDQIVRAYEEQVRLSLHAVEDQMLLIKTEHERAGFKY